MERLNSRQNTIFRCIEEHGSIPLRDLFARFDVSEATIRRDLALMEEEQLIMRRRGEAYVLKKSLESAFVQREHRNAIAKQRIARVAASFIQEHDTIILDAGTTTLEIAKLLVERSNLTVLTNSLPVANTLAHTNVSLLLAGGHLFSQNMSTQGPDAEAFFKKVEVNKSFIGASGVRSSIGLETLNPYEAEIKRLMVQSAKQVWAVIDAEKFDTAGINVFCTFDELDYIITDQAIRDETVRAKLKEHHVQVLVPGSA
ncbi:MAG: DeoR/GlpR family DNA-binding transcription regulator [Spirochaetota bacterium]|jgi:DeoR/GlpR family transcriptional regulator of sugar metabolism|nr:DeoR/GlpR family DNA-binding transcription regulator [Spirochaetota bacterium]